MLEHYIETLKKDKTFFIGDDITEKKLKGAASSYAENFDDTIILYDDTVFGSAKEGFLLTKTHFSCKTNNLDKFQIPLHNINEIQYKKTLFSGNIYINDVKVAECVQARKESVRDFCLLLKYLIEDIKNNTSHTSQARHPHHTDREKQEKPEINPLLAGKIFINNIKKPSSTNEIFEAIVSNIENNDERKAGDLCIYFIENSGEAVLISSKNDALCPPIVQEFAMELVKKLSAQTIETPGFLAGIILLYRTTNLMESNQINKLESIKKAANYFKLGVTKKHPASYFYLAEILERYPELASELEVEIQPSILYWMGAMQKHPLALSNIADKYLSTDMELGMFFHRLAAENGNIHSYETLNGDNISLRLIPSASDKNTNQLDIQNIALRHQVGEKEDAQTQYELGVELFSNEDYTRAAAWFRKAAEQGHAVAQRALGILYFQGDFGVPSSFSKAADWFYKAAKQGDAEAQYYLGLMFENGYDIPQDDAKAASWYRKAAEQGHPEALEKLGF